MVRFLFCLINLRMKGNRTISGRCNTPFFPGISRGSTSTYKARLLLFILWTFDATKRRKGQKDCEGGNLYILYVCRYTVSTVGLKNEVSPAGFKPAQAMLNRSSSWGRLGQNTLSLIFQPRR